MAKAPRALPSWIEGFMEFTQHSGSPRIFSKWCGIAAVAGALERKVWVRTRKGQLFPNLFTVLIGPPGVGKTVVTSVVEDLWRGLNDHWLAPKSVSKASLIDSLNDAKRIISTPGLVPPEQKFNSLLVNAGELGVLIPTYDGEFMTALTDIYDGRMYEERRRTKDLHIKIAHPNLNLLAADTPSHLTSMLPEGAWDQGFLSRTMLVYSGASVLTDLFGDDDLGNMDLFSTLKADLKSIGQLIGQFTMSPEAQAAMSAWHMAGGPPTPDHPKLVNYVTRRSAHLLKLCMISSAMSRTDLVIDQPGFALALDWLLELEAELPEVFKAMNSGGDTQAINEAWYFLFGLWKATKKPVDEHRLVAFLSEKIPSHSVLRVIEVMERSGKIKAHLMPTGRTGWEPLTVKH